MQARAEVQDTLYSTLPPGLGEGVFWIDQDVPFHASARVTEGPSGRSSSPRRCRHWPRCRTRQPGRSSIRWCAGDSGSSGSTTSAVPRLRQGVKRGGVPRLPGGGAGTGRGARHGLQDAGGLGIGGVPDRPCGAVPRLGKRPAAGGPHGGAHTGRGARHPVQGVALADGLGAARNDHAVPFHASARVSWPPALFLYQPTAMHARGEVHDTPFSTPAEAPGGSGAGLMDQRVPFHSSASGVSARTAEVAAHGCASGRRGARHAGQDGVAHPGGVGGGLDRQCGAGQGFGQGDDAVAGRVVVPGDGTRAGRRAGDSGRVGAAGACRVRQHRPGGAVPGRDVLGSGHSDAGGGRGARHAGEGHAGQRDRLDGPGGAVPPLDDTPGGSAGAGRGTGHAGQAGAARLAGHVLDGPGGAIPRLGQRDLLTLNGPGAHRGASTRRRAGHAEQAAAARREAGRGLDRTTRCRSTPRPA